MNKEVVIWGKTLLSENFIYESLSRGFSLNLNEDETSISDNDIIFFFQNSLLNPQGWFDTKKLDELVELWGYSFENGISVQNKIFVICCDLNPGDTKKIHEILNPMNINVCFLPIHNTNINPPRIPIGTLNPWVVSEVSNYLNKIFFKDIHTFSMSSLSVELLNLGLSQTKLSKNLSLTNYKNTLTRESILDEYPLFESFLDYKPQIEYKEDVLRNKVLSKYIDLQGLPNNVAKNIVEEKQKNTEFVVNEFLKSETPKTTSIIVDGLCYSESTFVDYNKYQLIKELITLGYFIVVLEDEEFIRGKIPLEMSNDFGKNIKFYKKGSSVDGYLLPL